MTKFDLVCEQIKSKLNYSNEIQTIGTTSQQAAVALILRQNLEATEVLMIKRAIRLGDHWSGNLALPGGRWQIEDANLLYTAIRETFEETGMNLANGGQILGQLDTLKPRSPVIPKVDVSPFIYTAPFPFHIIRQDLQPQPLILNDEVAAAFWVSLDYLESQGLSDAFQLIVEGEERTWPAYPSEHGPIWGMTERILTDFLKLL